MKIKATVLIIDKEINKKNFLINILKEKNFDIITSSTFEEGIKNANKVDLIIADLSTIPIKEIKSKIIQDKLLLITSSKSIDTALSLFKEKSISVEEVETSISKFLEREEKKIISAIFSATEALLTSFELQEIQDKIISICMETIKADRVSLMLVDENGELYIAASYGIPEDIAKKVKIKKGERTAGKVLIDKKPIVIYGEKKEDHIEAKIKSSVIQPLMVKGKLVGVLNVSRVNIDKKFSEIEINAINILARFIAIAIENMKLYEQLKSRIEEQIIQVEKLNVIKKFATIITHHLRTPFAVITSNVQSALRYDLDPKIKLKLKSIERSISQANIIVKEFLNMARPQEISMSAKVSLSEILNNIVNTVSQKCEEGRIMINKDFPSDLPQIRCDRVQLEHALLNFVVNSIEAMKNGGKLTIYSRKNENYVVIKIIDEGCGIPNADLDKLFTPFFTRKEDGIGLGLYSSDQIIKAHLGKVEIESEVGKGTTVTVTLPILP